MDGYPTFVMEPDGDPVGRPSLTLEPTWWSTGDNQAMHVLIGDVWIANIELVDGSLVVTKQANATE